MGLFTVLAAIATTAVGSGVILADTITELHVDPVGFFRHMAIAWDSQRQLGFQDGWLHGYECPYGWAYAGLKLAHVSDWWAQRLVDFAVFFGTLVSMYWGLGRMTAGTLSPQARMFAATAYLFNMYVVFNASGSYTAFMTPYAVTPALIGATEEVLAGSRTPLSGSALAAVLVLTAGGVNPPLIVLLAILVAGWVVFSVALADDRRERLRRSMIFAPLGTAFVVAVNCYWLVPFAEFQHAFWLGGQLDESPLMHNRDSSFANVLRGLGQWGIFQSDARGPWYAWAPTYAAGFFAAALWLPVLLAALGATARSRTAVSYFLVTLAVSVPLVVGYYVGPGGPAVTQGLYDLLYSHAPYFQIFRSAYKLVWPAEFAICALAAFGLDRLLASAGGAGFARRGLTGLAVVAVVAIFAPVVAIGENRTVQPVPSWWKHASRLATTAPNRRVALTPSQYVPSYHWAEQIQYLEYAALSSDLVGGYISGAPAEGSHMLMTRAYHAARAGLPEAPDLFRTLGVSEVLQRDDFEGTSDFSYLGQNVFTNTTVAHDVDTRVLGGRPLGVDGALRTYALDNSLPQVYATRDVVLSSRSALGFATSATFDRIAGGAVAVTGEGLDDASLAALVAGGAAVSPERGAADELAVSMATDLTTVPFAMPLTAFRLPAGARYAVFSETTAFYPALLAETYLPPPAVDPANFASPDGTVDIDGRQIGRRDEGSGRWTRVGDVDLSAGWHVLDVARLSLRPYSVFRFVPIDRLTRDRTAIAASLKTARRHEVEIATSDDAATVDLGTPGSYAIDTRLARTGGEAFVEATIPAVRGRFSTAVTVPAGSLASGAAALPWINADGTVQAAEAPLPEPWYGDERTFAWSRGETETWYLLTRRAHLTVFSPAAAETRVLATFRLAPLDRHSTYRVFVNGTFQDAFALDADGEPSSSAGAVPNGAYAPVVASARLRLSSGQNDVEIRSDAAGRSASLVAATSIERRPITAALASDLTFRTIAPVKAAPPPPPPFDLTTGGTSDAYARFSFPPNGGRESFIAETIALDVALAGAPRVRGRIAYASSGTAEWIGIAYRHARSGRTDYRVRQFVASDGSVDVGLADALENASTDEDVRVTGLWLIFAMPDSTRRSDATGEFAIDDLRLARTAMPASLQTIRLDPASVGGDLRRLDADDRRTAISASGGTIRLSVPPGVALGHATVDVRLPVRASRAAGFRMRVRWSGADAPHASLEVRRGSNFLPGSRDVALATSLLGETRTIETYRLEIPSAMRPTSDDIDAGRFHLFDATTPFSESDAHVPQTYAATGDAEVGHLTELQATVGRGRVPRFHAVFDSTRVTNGDHETEIVSDGGDDGRASDVRLVLDDPSIDVSMARTFEIDRPVIVDPGDGRIDGADIVVDGRRFGRRGSLAAGHHVVSARVGSADLASIRLRDGGGLPRVNVDARRADPSHWSVAVPAMRGPFVLVLGQSYHPHWEALDRGRSLPHVMANGYANGWIVSPGPARTILLTFTEQRSYDITFVVFLVASSAAIATLAWPKRRSRRRSPA